MENITAVIRQESAKISCNFEQVEEALQERLSEYENAVFTEDSKVSAKKEIAKLRKEKKDLQDNLRDAKKQYMAPWDAFEPEAKKLIRMYDDPISLISGQVQEMEEKRIHEKMAEIQSAYEEMVPDDLQDYIPLECIYGDKWNNATTSMKSIKKEISEITAKTQGEIAVIASMGSEKVPDALKLYMSNRSLAGAVKFINDYEAGKREILERQKQQEAERAGALRQEEAERIRREERARIAEEERIRKEARKEAVEEIKTVDEAAAAPLSDSRSIKAVYTVVGTPEELQEVETAITSFGLYFERKYV